MCISVVSHFTACCTFINHVSLLLTSHVLSCSSFYFPPLSPSLSPFPFLEGMDGYGHAVSFVVAQLCLVTQRVVNVEFIISCTVYVCIYVYMRYIFGYSRRDLSFPNCRAWAWAQLLLVRHRDAPCVLHCFCTALHCTAPCCIAPDHRVHLSHTNGPCTEFLCNVASYVE